MKKTLLTSLAIIFITLSGCGGARPPQENRNTIWEVIDSNRQSYFTHELFFLGYNRVQFTDSADGRRVILYAPVIREIPYKIRDEFRDGGVAPEALPVPPGLYQQGKST